MSKQVITPEKEKFILENYLKHPSRDLGQKLGVSKTAVLRCLRINNKVVPIEVIKEWRQRKKLSKPYTEIEKQFIKDNIDKLSIKKIAQHLKRCNSKIRPIIKELGLDYVVEQKKIASRIQLGNVPPNKGKKISEYMNAAQLEVFKSNQYKKGSIPHNALPDNAEVQRYEKSGKIYTLVKVPGQRKLILKHRHVWEQHHNIKVPKQHMIIFKDGDTTNFSIDNLECISFQEQMLKNSIHNYPQDLKEVIQTKGRLTRAINKYNNQQP